MRKQLPCLTRRWRSTRNCCLMRTGIRRLHWYAAKYSLNTGPYSHKVHAYRQEQQYVLWTTANSYRETIWSPIQGHTATVGMALFQCHLYTRMSATSPFSLSCKVGIYPQKTTTHQANPPFTLASCRRFKHPSQEEYTRTASRWAVKLQLAGVRLHSCPSTAMYMLAHHLLNTDEATRRLLPRRWCRLRHIFVNRQNIRHKAYWNRDTWWRRSCSALDETHLAIYKRSEQEAPRWTIKQSLN